ncbi:hypothetical protein PHYSODRAFT_254168 [Phytophthora sojae]|uniref:Uncharacterized protein n=1 Tax=Phytophthora sojae (strain P6497) TaxID=1094619 RepID=G5A9D1_PHYSP|nr:hypothetical protein PHYSODRAFT_254168 [Phytophthora sojae]EGZ08507.1 hypothetical protein PHYSODRAFT_254168 [Phytophthora sojae]|eukprot:XP_009536679.1 hypothetical protein PHYSODRAFT_254168 [Phytophthora sojae]
MAPSLASTLALRSPSRRTPSRSSAGAAVEDKDTKYNPLAFLEGQGFATQEGFDARRRDNGYKTLRDFMDRGKYTVTQGADYFCGWTNPKGTPQPIPRSTGYTHDGPCEIWLDDVRVLERSPTIDYSSCEKKGGCTMHWYWLGVRFLKNSYSWQVYKECIPLTAAPKRLRM